MKFLFQRKWLAPAGLTVALAFVIGVTMMVKHLGRSPLERAASRFDDDDRLRYRAALEKLRYELRAPPGSPAFESVMDRDRLLAAAALDDKKARLLLEKCGIEISEELILAEYERLKEDPGDLRVLAAITEALDRDPAALIEFWLRPTLVDRYLRACVSMDESWNAEARANIQRLRSDNGVRTESAELVVNLSGGELEPEDREALIDAGPGEVTGVVESPDDFHYFVVNGRSGDTVKAGLVSVPKPRLEEWLDRQE